METNKSNNPSAFPYEQSNEQFQYANKRSTGMSLRDYLSAKAMQAMITGIYSNNKPTKPDEYLEMIENVVSNSYYIADAMLKKREL